MASTPTCELHNDHDADYIIGDVQTGAQLMLCTEGAAHFGLTLALANLDPAEIINAAQAIGATPPANGTEGTGSKPARKRATKKTSKPGTRTESQPGLSKEPPASVDG